MSARLPIDVDLLGYWGLDEANGTDPGLDESLNAMPLSISEKKRFRQIGHQLNPVVLLGGQGLSEAVLAEIERAQKRIGSSLEAAPKLYIADKDLAALIASVDFADICITSGIEIIAGEGPADAFRLDDVGGVAVVPVKASGVKCARSWRYFDPATADKDFPDITPRDAQAMREWQARAHG